MNVKLSKTVYYLLSFSWGILTNFSGAFIALILLISGLRPQKYGYCVCFELGKAWGGCNMGIFIFANHAADENLKNHEHGHSIQNCFLGPFMLFFICIPSTVRYWYYQVMTKKQLADKLKPYDSIWFESQATKLGREFMHWLHSTERKKT